MIKPKFRADNRALYCGTDPRLRAILGNNREVQILDIEGDMAILNAPVRLNGQRVPFNQLRRILQGPFKPGDRVRYGQPTFLEPWTATVVEPIEEIDGLTMIVPDSSGLPQPWRTSELQLIQ